jgi:hypothetical protein
LGKPRDFDLVGADIQGLGDVCAQIRDEAVLFWP